MSQTMPSSAFEDSKPACFRCGRPPEDQVHGKAYRDVSYTAHISGTAVGGNPDAPAVLITAGEPYRTQWQHKYEPGMLVRAVPYDLDMTERAPDPRPRCRRRDCDGRDRRQPVGVRFCGFCAQPMPGTNEGG